jgi:mannose-1-phosphate guanylyltransferase
MLKLSHRIKKSDDSAESSPNAPAGRVALLLAGGDGIRLQEFTRQIAGVPIPKQYCRLLHGSSLLEATLSRAHLFAPREHISVVVNQDHLALAREQLRILPETNVFVQPRNKDTGPGMVFALLNLLRTYSDPIVAVFPTDHYVDDDRAFIAHVLRAVNTISHMPEKIAVLGIAPDRPETGYGYILPASPLDAFEKAYHVETFTEKPSLLGAHDIISRGGLWNTFVMVFKLSRMLELLCELIPEEVAKLSTLCEKPEMAAELYSSLDSWNLSTQVLARVPQHLIMVEVGDVRWSDWGTRESIERTYRSLNMVPFWNMSHPFGDPIPG